MAGFDKLAKELENAMYVVQSHKTHGIHYNPDHQFVSSTLQGYGLSNEELEFTIQQGVPVIDLSVVPEAVLRRFVSSVPMVGAKYEPLPWSSMSYAPLEVVASIWQLAGAKVHNIDTVRLVPGMIKNTDGYERMIHDGYFYGDAEKMMQGLVEGSLNDIVPDAELPVDLDTDPKIAQLLTLIYSKIKEQQAANNVIKQNRRDMSFTEFRDHYPKYEDQIPAICLQRYQEITAPVLYNALLQASGQLNTEDAMQRIDKSVTQLVTAEKDKLKGKSRKDYGTHFVAMKEVGTLAKVISKQCKPEKRRTSQPSM